MIANIRGSKIYFDIAGMQIAPDRKGSFIERPVLFLIHGGPGGNHLGFKFNSLELQKHAQLVFIDQRGCGFSKKMKSSEYTLKNNIEDIEALRKYLGLSKISVMGVSYGGMVAQGYAIKYSKYIDKLVLAVTAPSHHFIDEAKAYLEKNGTNKQIAICNKYLWDGAFRNNKDVESYFNELDPLYFFKAVKRRSTKVKGVDAYVSKHSALNYEVLNAGFSSFLHTFNFIPKLHKITCPTLILAGENDWICSPNQAKIIAKNIKHAKLKIFKRAGHAFMSDVNKEYIKTVSGFLRKKIKVRVSTH